MKRASYYIAWFFIYVFASLIGKLWIFAVIPFRAQARNVVYNYTLQNGIRLKRLSERFPSETESGWRLKDVHGVAPLQGEIRRRKVSRLKYLLTVWLVWGWLDDDSNHDTTDLGHVRSVNAGEQFAWEAWLIRPWLRRYDIPDNVAFGNAFDLGDVRAEHPYYHWVPTFIWNTRNTAMNFKYLLLDY